MHSIIRLTSSIFDFQRAKVGERYASFLCFCGLLTADLITFALTGLVGLAAAQHIGLGSSGKEAMQILFASGASLLAFLFVFGRYSERLPFWSEFRIIVSVSNLGACFVAFWLLASGEAAQFFPCVLAFVLFPFLSAPANRFAKSVLSRSGLWTLSIVLISEKPVADVIGDAIRFNPSLGYRLIRHVHPATVTAAPAGVSLRSIMQRSGARRTIIALGSQHPLHHLVTEAMHAEHVKFVALSEKTYSLNTAFDAVSFLSYESLLMAMCRNRCDRLPRLVKAGFDVLAALLLLILFAPLLLIISAVNRWDGPVFFAHRRIGLGGRPFHCLKFRTMVADGQRVLQEALSANPALAQEWADTRKLRDDPRVTRIGRFLRATSVDELPQLINVLRLEMSLVGPRPIVDDEVGKFGTNIVHYYSTRPGITGLWQVSGRSNTSFVRRVQLDVWYAKNWTLWSDIVVLLRTIPAVLARDGAY